MGGGSQTSTTTIPAWLEAAAQGNLGRANQAAQIGYTPYYGPDVAAMTPMQNAAFDNTNQSAAAFGLAAPTGSGMPAPQTFAGGVQGYSSQPMYQGAVDALAANNPGQYAAINRMFIDPVTGLMPGQMPQQAAMAAPQAGRSSGTSSTIPMPQSTGPGFTSFADMFDGGGPGASGPTFQGGVAPISNLIAMPSKGGSSGMGGGK